jgi:hypothetical protein
MGDTSAMGILWVSLFGSSVVAMLDVMGVEVTVGEVEYWPCWGLVET